ncbi:X-ray repair cross-complementing protein 5 [Physocladia obscura]|uniref:ATP-dependent DNA helicase II subunit 2 n=1 Tax=Physocladia obscura TaxID=109957 RepID=A0AAD5XFQ5_9FUNG|nr:X-ray repair cross-complementing protein 5 [Physocladia obscura]
MRSFCSATDGDIFSATEALALLGELRSRTVRPTTLIRTTMYLGEPENSGSFGFQVWAYAKVKEAKLPSGKKWSRIGAEAVDVVDEFTRGEVAMERTYKVKDLVHTEDGENGDVAEPVELNKEDLIRAYKYGKDLIPFAEEDRDAMKLQTEKGFSIIGFVKNAEISREIFINDPMQIIPDPGATGNSKNMFEVLALSLKTKDVCALVRYVRIKDAPPKIGVLIPHIGKRIWCAWIQIPFKEDVREYAFTTLAPLLLDPGASTTQSQSFSESSSASLATTALNYGGLSSTGESKRKKMNFRTVDSAEADRRIDQFIDDMDLSTAIVDDDGEKFEAYKSIDIFNPGYQRIYQCIAYRVMNPGEKKLPPLDPRFVAGVLPMPELVEKAKRSFELVKDSFSIIKIETDKEDNRKRFKKGVDNAEDIERDVISAAAASAANINPTSDVTTFSFVSGSTVTSVGSAEPVADFAALLSRGDPVVSTAAMNQLAARVVAFVRESLGAQFYPKAISCIVALRRESIARKECIRYNDLLVELKALTADNSDQIQCKPFWAALKKESNTVGLITKQDVSESAFNVEEAAEFFETAALPASIIELEPVEEDDQDLIDMLD